MFGPDESEDRPAWNPRPMVDDLDGYETSMGRFLRRAKPFLGVLVAIAMIVPMGAGLLETLVFDRRGDAVTEELAADDLDVALTDSVLLVGATTCNGSGVSGTAFAAELDGRRVLVTNRHVVEDVSSVGLRTLDGEPGPRVASWRLATTADVAVLDLEDPTEVPPALALASDTAGDGAPVRTVGFPGGLPYTTSGVVAEVADGRVLYDMRVSPGASGSPVLDRDARVVGQVFATTDAGRTAVGTSVDALRSALGTVGPAVDGC